MFVLTEAQKEEAQFAAQAQQMQAAIMQNMSQIDTGTDGSTGISGSSVGQIVGLGSSEIGSAVAAYRAEVEEVRKTIDENLTIGGGQATVLKRQAQNLEKQKDQADVKVAALRAATEALLERMQVLQQERDSAQAYRAKLQQQLDKLGELEQNASQQDELENLKNLVSLNETLRGQESAFKESCKAQMAELKGMIAAAEGDDGRDSEEEKKLRDIEDMHGKVGGPSRAALESLLLY